MPVQVVNTETKFDDTDAFMLTDLDSGEILRMIPCDTAGNFSWTGVTRAPLTRNAMQTSSTSNQYSDLELPWLSIPQENWTGGRGNEIFTKDTTRYYDGKRAQASFNEVVFNGPLDYYSKGAFRPAVTNFPTSVHWEQVPVGSTNAISVTLDVNEAFTSGEVYLLVRRVGTPTKAISYSYRITGGSTSSGGGSFCNTTAIKDTVSEFYKISLSKNLYAGGTVTLSFFVVSGGTYDDNNHWEIGCNSSDKPIVRIAPAQQGYKHIFFMYEQMMYCIRQLPNGTPTLWMNGDICKATAVTDTTITDSSKTWAVNQFAGARVGMVYRKGIQGQITVWKTIVSNTADTLTISEDWDVNPEENAYYIIVDTPLWTEITGHGLVSAVTDVEVVDGLVFICQGDYVPYRVMAYDFYHHQFVFGYEHVRRLSGTEGCCASFIKAVRDSAGMMLWRGRNDTADINGSTLEVIGKSARVREISCTPLCDRIFYDTNAQVNLFRINRTSAVTTSGGTVIPTFEYAMNPYSGDIWTDSQLVDFGTGDKNFIAYEVTIGSFTSSENTGVFTIVLQESTNAVDWRDVKSFVCTAEGMYQFYAHCQYKYRRFKFTATGTSCNVNNIRITPSVGINNVCTYDNAIILKDNYGKITQLTEYGAEQYKSLWIFQEGMVSSVNKVDGTTDTYTLDRINIDELQTTAEEWNASTIESSDVYLTFAWLNGFQRYYNTQLEGKGPDKDAGLPFNRQGRITKVISYPSNIFVAVDAEDGYSSVLQFNQSGWCEIYRAPNAGERIQDMYFQPIYGTRPDRLWMSVGDDIVWLAMPSKTLYALQDPNAEYTHESVLISAWHTAGMMDVEKLWQSLKIMADNLTEDVCWIEADYQVDEDNAWHPIENLYTTSPSQKEELNPDGSVNGKKLRYRLRIYTTDIHKTPKVNAIVLEAVGRVDIKWSYTFYFRNIKWKRNLTAGFENIEPLDVQNKLDEWANGLKKLRMNSRWKIFDNKIVYLDAVQTSILTELQEGYIAQITLNEL